MSTPQIPTTTVLSDNDVLNLEFYISATPTSYDDVLALGIRVPNNLRSSVTVNRKIKNNKHRCPKVRQWK